MNRRRLLQSGAACLAGSTAGCLGLLGSEYLVTTDVQVDGSAGIVTIDVTVENRADGRRRGTVVASVDTTARAGSVSKRQEVEVAAGDTATVDFFFSNLIPAGQQSVGYSTDVSIVDVHDPAETENVVEETASDDELGVTVTVTYTQGESQGAPRLSETEYEAVRCPETAEGAVTPFVNFDLLHAARSAAVTFSYDPSAVPDGGESALVCYQFDRQSQEFSPLEDSAADAEANTVSGTITRAGIVDVVVFHGPTWRSVRANHSGTVNTWCR